MDYQVIYDSDNWPAFVVMPWRKFRDMEDRLYDFEHGIIPKKIENPVKLMRVMAGLTQTELAELMGISQSRVGQIECPRTKPTAKMIERVKQAIDSQ
jgi:DNA-binding XRE family transcriptional regulator